MPDIHIQWTLSLGNILTLLAMLASARPMMRIYRAALVILAEHEMLKEFVCEHQGMSPQEFSTMAMARVGSRKAKAARTGG